MPNLYKVTCKGMHVGIAHDVAHGIAYVVAEDAADAYRKVRERLDRDELGLTRDRAMDRVELLAESDKYPDCGFRLYT